MSRRRIAAFFTLFFFLPGVVTYADFLPLQAASTTSEMPDEEKQEEQEEIPAASELSGGENQEEEQDVPAASELSGEEKQEEQDASEALELSGGEKQEEQESPVLTELSGEAVQEDSVEDKTEADTAGPILEETVPIYNYDIINVVVPVNFSMALNPYELPIRMKDGGVCTDQVLSANYGIVNKSSTDKIVTVTLTVEDLNEDKIVFVDSSEEAEEADENTYAVYLAAVPADEGAVLIGENGIGEDTTAEELSEVTMSGASEQAVALHEGTTQISFRLSRASYDFRTRGGDDTGTLSYELTGLAPDGNGVTAFTFGGTMNQKADWTKLLRGIRISAVYTYKTADGSEKIMEGTGAVIAVE